MRYVEKAEPSRTEPMPTRPLPGKHAFACEFWGQLGSNTANISTWAAVLILSVLVGAMGIPALQRDFEGSIASTKALPQPVEVSLSVSLSNESIALLTKLRNNCGIDAFGGYDYNGYDYGGGGYNYCNFGYVGYDFGNHGYVGYDFENYGAAAYGYNTFDYGDYDTYEFADFGYDTYEFADCGHNTYDFGFNTSSRVGCDNGVWAYDDYSYIDYGGNSWAYDDYS